MIGNYEGFDPSSPDVDWVARLTDTGKYDKWGKIVENREWNDLDPATWKY